jgi:hypothetical protein
MEPGTRSRTRLALGRLPNSGRLRCDCPLLRFMRGNQRRVLIAACLVAASSAAAESWRFTPSAGITETVTDNVNYAPRDGAKNDFVTSVTAALGINGEGKRVKLNGSIAATAELYARESQNNAITPNVSLTGNVEAIERFFFVDAAANVSTQFLSPYGPQPGSTANATANRYTSQTYSVSPYIKGEFGASGITYELRDQNTWTIGGTYGDSSVKPPDTYSNLLTASVTSAAKPQGWRVEYEHAGGTGDLHPAIRRAVAGRGPRRLRHRRLPADEFRGRHLWRAIRMDAVGADARRGLLGTPLLRLVV